MTDTEKAEYDDVVRMLTMKLEQLAAENARLRSEKSDALSVLREVYNDPTASPAHRIKAAGLALPHEVPRLESAPPPLDLIAEPVEPLADLVARQRARADRMMLEDPQFLAVRSISLKDNGSDGDDRSD
jgi:hypothetical protein